MKSEEEYELELNQLKTLIREMSIGIQLMLATFQDRAKGENDRSVYQSSKELVYKSDGIRPTK